MIKKLNSIFFKPRKYKSFAEVYGNRKLISSSYRGTKAIKVNKIVGSVNRWQKNYTISVDKKSDRYRAIKEAMEKMANLPPIKVYDVDGEYYILDGHHRVEASREIGQDFLDAEIIEYKFH